MNVRNRAIETGTKGGIEWALVNAPMFGAINGYARIPKDHPWSSATSYDDAVFDKLVVNGGLTYGPDNDGWVGFDTLHSDDYWPGMDASWRTDHAKHWTQALVRTEAESLAYQIAMAGVPE